MNLSRPFILRPVATTLLMIALLLSGSFAYRLLPVVYDLVDTRRAQRRPQLPGVGLVSLAGGQRPAGRVEVNPNALASAGLGMGDIRAAISAANVNMPKGSFDGPTRAIMLDANAQKRSAQE